MRPARYRGGIVNDIKSATEDQKTAIAQAAMLKEIASGRYKPKKADEPQRRFDSLLTFILTGQCAGDEQTQRIIEQLGQEMKPILKSVAA